MNPTPRPHNSCLFFIIVCFVFLLGSTTPSLAVSTQSSNKEVNVQASGEPPVELIEIKEKISSFEYQIEGRPDPFLPFITERATNNENPDEIIDENTMLTGMQLFEPGQLTLVALMMSGGNKYAMVQDFTGKGYVITEGTKIGRRGVVSSIVDNKVIIQETAITRGGSTLTNSTAMVLKKEGEE